MFPFDEYQNREYIDRVENKKRSWGWRFLVVIIGLVLLAQGQAQPGFAQSGKDVRALLAKAQTQGSVRVIVGVRATFQPEGKLDARAAQTQRRAIAQAQAAVLNQLATRNVRTARTFQFVPYLALEVDANALTALAASANVTRIQEDKWRTLSLSESTALIGATTAWASGYAGAGQVVAILDTGVDKTHPFLAGKVVSEACYSTTYTLHGATSLCPGGVPQSTDPDSALPCTVTGSCAHGTHVAGIAAGKDPGGLGFSGVARDANIIAIQVFSYISSCACLGAYDSDIIAALERVYALSSVYNIAAANLSLGGEYYASQAECDLIYSFYNDTLENLRAVGIATVIASGNDYSANSISAPACVSSAISVGSTLDGGWGATPADAVSSFSNSASFLSLLAPGQYIYSSVPGNSYANMGGTSMATPHVAGAWAVLKSRAPAATVDRILGALTSTGVPVFDSRNGITKPRIQINFAASALGPPFIYHFPIILRDAALP